MLDGWESNERTKELVLLLIECRDALPAISQVSARLHYIDLSLASRIETVLKPWKVKDGEDGI